METRSSVVWHAISQVQALSELETDAQGLSPEEAARRLERFGPNVIPTERPPSKLRVLARQLNNPIIYLLFAASGIALALGKTTDAAVVFAAIAINALIGYLQEVRAGEAIEALSRMVPSQATALRAGRAHSVPATGLVPGDVILLSPGDRVPADARLLSANGLRIDEAALTGESVPATKHVRPVEAGAALGDRTSMAFGGTTVAAGTAQAVVTQTAGRTELGRISHLLGEVQPLQTPLTRTLARLGRLLTLWVVVLSAVLFLISLRRGYPLSDGLLVTVTLAVATIPEGLPAIITIALAIGVQRMALRRAIVRRLPSVETLGSTTVICTDKTGTLTRNEMTVQALLTAQGEYALSGVGFDLHGALSRAGAPLPSAPPEVVALLRAGVLCNDAALHREGDRVTQAGDPTEVALLVGAEKLQLPAAEWRDRWPRRQVLPFDSERQLMATLNEDPEGGRWVLIKGAPEVVVPRCRPWAGQTSAGILAEAGRLASRGMRVLAMAQARAGAGSGELDLLAPAEWELLGLQGMIDPPRPEAIAAVRACRAAGVTVKMITGDHRATAEAIGREIGLLGASEAGTTGNEVAALPESGLSATAGRTHVFARVAPEHKLRLVQALQGRGEVVAMTGDGVNDSPSLKQANIGIAMGITGTAAAKEAADIVLADDNFATIAAAVEEGRRIYDNLLKSVAFVLPTNLGLGLILCVAVLLFPIERVGGELMPLLPMLPTQLLWVNLIASVALALPLAFEVAERDVMRRPPRDPAAPLLGSFVIARTLTVAALMCLAAVLLFLWEYRREAARVGPALALREAQTMAVTTVTLFQSVYLFNCRSLTESAFRLGFFTNRTVFLGVGVLLALQAGFIYLPFMNAVFSTAPLNPRDLLVSLLVASTVLPVVTLEKALRARRRRRSRGPPPGIRALRPASGEARG